MLQKTHWVDDLPVIDAMSLFGIDKHVTFLFGQPDLT